MIIKVEAKVLRMVLKTKLPDQNPKKNLPNREMK